MIMAHLHRLDLIPLSMVLVAGLLAPATAVAQATDSVTARIYNPDYFPPCTGRVECPRMPRALAWQGSNPMPIYPGVMRAVGIEGEVDLTFIVNADGGILDSSVVFTKSTNRAFEAAVRTAMASWQLPLRPESGPPEAVRTELSVTFMLTGTCRDRDVPQHLALMDPHVTRLLVLWCEAELQPRN